MSSLTLRPGHQILALTLSLLTATCTASPISINIHTLSKRKVKGSTVGMGVGVAVAAIIFICVLAFVINHVRRSQRNRKLNHERAVVSGEKNPDGTDKVDHFDESNGHPKRTKSVRDRLMGPLYQDAAQINLKPMSKAHLANGKAGAGKGGKEGAAGADPLANAHWDAPDARPFLHKPWADDSSSLRPSFSSKRATRMMMMM